MWQSVASESGDDAGCGVDATNSVMLPIRDEQVSRGINGQIKSIDCRLDRGTAVAGRPTLAVSRQGKYSPRLQINDANSRIAI